MEIAAGKTAASGSRYQWVAQTGPAYAYIWDSDVEKWVFVDPWTSIGDTVTGSTSSTPDDTGSDPTPGSYFDWTISAIYQS